MHRRGLRNGRQRWRCRIHQIAKNKEWDARNPTKVYLSRRRRELRKARQDVLERLEALRTEQEGMSGSIS